MARSLDLAGLRDIREALDATDGAPSLLTTTELNELLSEYVPLAGIGDDALHRLFDELLGEGASGAALLVQGAAGAGKTHLLCVAALLLEYPALRSLFLQSHPEYEEILRRMDRRRAPLVVPVSLQEHRAEDEHLEDIVFDCVEQELGRPRYGMKVPLSEQSYALDLIERHILPRYQRGLDAHVRQRYGGYGSWNELSEQDRGAAVSAAQGFAAGIGYPLDFRQSRMERMARLTEVVQGLDVSGVVWLIDDLWQFLAGAGGKAVRNDIAFLEFLGQRTKLERLYLLVTTRAGLEELSGIEPYVVAGIRDAFDSAHRLEAARMRRVAHTRAIHILNADDFEEAMGQVHSAYRQALGEPSFSEAELRASYPLHPAAEPILENIYQKYFAEGDALVDFLETLRASGGAMVLERAVHRLVSLPEIFDLLSSRLAAHPRASDYVREVLDYYEKNAARISPDHPDEVLSLTKALIMLSMGNMPAASERMAELIGLDEEGHPLVATAMVQELLEQMRLRGNYVDMRGGDGRADYAIEIHTNLGELARRRLMTARSGFVDGDARLWQAARSAAARPDFPLAHFDEAKTLEIVWENTTRFVAAETTDLKSITGQDLKDEVAELAAVDTEHTCRVHIAELLNPEGQAKAFAEASLAVADQRFADGLIAWLPRALSEVELDKVRQFAACRQVLREPSSTHEQPEVGDRIAEEAAMLEPEVGQMVARAYRDGRLLTAAGHEAALDAATRDAPIWADLLGGVVSGSLARLYPDFVAMAPRRAVTGTRIVDRLLEGVIKPGALEMEADAGLAAMAEDVLGPMGLVQHDEGTLFVDVRNSPAAAAVMERVRARDKTAESERGRPLSYADLGLHLAKSPAGITPELFELTIACLLRTGWLVAVDMAGDSLPSDVLDGPIRSRVAQVARAPLLSMGEWRSLTRIAKMVLGTSVPRPDHAMQTSIHAGLVEAAELNLKRIAAMKARVAQLQGTLGQAASQWSKANATLDEVAEFFGLMDATLMPAEGLKKLVNEGQRFLEGDGGPALLTRLLRQADGIWSFLQGTAVSVITMRTYLLDERLRLDSDPDLRARQQRLLALIGTGEQMISEATTFARLSQIFLATYKRRYLNWHRRCHRPALFERYRSLRAAPELRALAQLQRLDLQVEDDPGRVFEILDAQLQRQCGYEALATALDRQPICPECHLQLDVDLDLVPPEEILELALAGIRAYVARMKEAEFHTALVTYASGVAGRGELATRLDRVLHLDDEPNARHILTLFNDELISHLNRMVSGKRLKVREFSRLRELLSGRTMSAEEALALFERWLAGDRGDDDDDEDQLIHVEP